jgi:hypothetical protein
MAPAWHGTRANPQAAMNANPRGIADGHSRFSSGRPLAIFQMALSVVLVTGAVLMAGTFRNLASADIGFDQNHGLLVAADLNNIHVSAGRLYLAAERIRERLSALPGVLSASFSDVANQRSRCVSDNRGRRIHPEVAEGIDRLDYQRRPSAVQINGVAAPLLYISRGQINALLPDRTKIGTATESSVSAVGVRFLRLFRAADVGPPDPALSESAS